MSSQSCQTYESLLISPNWNNQNKINLENKKKSKGMFSKLMLKLKGNKSKATSKHSGCTYTKRSNNCFNFDQQNVDDKLQKQSNGDFIYYKAVKPQQINKKKAEPTPIGDAWNFDTKSLKAVEKNSSVFYDTEKTYCDSSENCKKKRSLVVEVRYKGFELTDGEKDFVRKNLTDALKKIMKNKKSEVCSEGSICQTTVCDSATTCNNNIKPKLDAKNCKCCGHHSKSDTTLSSDFAETNSQLLTDASRLSLPKYPNYKTSLITSTCISETSVDESSKNESLVSSPFKAQNIYKKSSQETFTRKTTTRDRLKSDEPPTKDAGNLGATTKDARELLKPATKVTKELGERYVRSAFRLLEVERRLARADRTLNLLKNK